MGQDEHRLMKLAGERRTPTGGADKRDMPQHPADPRKCSTLSHEAALMRGVEARKRRQGLRL